MNELRTLAQRIDFSNDSPQTLVCASYRYRREVGEAAAALPRPWRELSRQMKARSLFIYLRVPFVTQAVLLPC